MELWIRSQDRNSLNCVRNIRINGLSIMCYSGEVLGEYSTRRRALEVLDEIQKFMIPKEREGEYEEIDLILKSHMIPRIYEMPEE